MNLLKNTLDHTKTPLLSIYYTAGFPHLEDTLPILKDLEKSGVDMVELGMPFSDPLADGPTIQASSQVALANGMSLKVLFQQLKDLRKEVTIPVLLMGYLNPVLQYGIETFLKDCQATGISGLILPDLPLDEYEEHYRETFEQYEVPLVFLVTPETPPERLQRIDALSKAFIYAVSSSSTTGSDKNWKQNEQYFLHLKDSLLKSPVVVGFGIKDQASFQAATQYTQGGIIGTAFVKVLQEEGEQASKIHTFIQGIRNGEI